jgi:TLC domain
MERRMRALIRKAEPSLSTRPELLSMHFKEGLVQLLGSLVHNKREYSEMFETPEATESFAIKHGFSDAQRDLLIAMQANKDIFVPNPLLDAVCTFIFLAECAYIAYHLMGQGLLVVFLGLLFVTDCVISRVKKSSQVIGSHLSAWVHKKGYVDVDPLSGNIQMKKWTEQSWQLFSHVVFSAIELRILSEERWYDEPAHCWIPHPYDQIGNHRTDLVILYLTQLAVWVYTCIIHRFFDERRKDYFVMYVHHIVTIMLVGELLL